VGFTINTTGVISGAGTDYISGAPYFVHNRCLVGFTINTAGVVVLMMNDTSLHMEVVLGANLRK
jgi:hypothetical protein